MFEFYGKNEGLCQQDWHEARTFREACNVFAEQVQHVLLFDTKDLKLQHLTAKLYHEWCNERYLSGQSLKAYDEFTGDVLRNAIRKLVKDFNINF